MDEKTRYVKQAPMTIAPVTLEGRKVRLIPMTREDVDALFAAANFSEIWELTGTLPMKTVEDMRNYVDVALAERDAGGAIPFVTTDAVTGEIIGSTRFAGIDLNDHRVAVSYTHLRAHETGRNLVCRLLLEKKKTDK